MILADKIMRLRKKNGWSQEELAEKMQVSRQAVSKWEGAQSIPDLDKLLALSRLFGVTTDYLLKDEIEDEETAQEGGETVRRVTLAQANAYLAWRHRAAVLIAAGVFLCVLAAAQLMLLAAATETTRIDERIAAPVALTALLVLVAAAVGLFIACGIKNAPYAFIDEEPFETEYGVEGLVSERRRAYRDTHARYNVAGICLCILAPIPLFIGVYTERLVFAAAMTAVTVLLAGIGAFLLIVTGVRWASMQKLLMEGEYAPQERKRRRIKGNVSSAFWLTAVAIYLGWSFYSRRWKESWVIWPIAGVLFAAVRRLCNLLIPRQE